MVTHLLKRITRSEYVNAPYKARPHMNAWQSLLKRSDAHGICPVQFLLWAF